MLGRPKIKYDTFIHCANIGGKREDKTKLQREAIVEIAQDRKFQPGTVFQSLAESRDVRRDRKDRAAAGANSCSRSAVSRR